MLIRDLPPGERPMERLARLGPQALQDVELLAILLGGQTALEAATTALEDGLARLQNRATNPLLTAQRQAKIVVLLELSRRLEALEEKPSRVVLGAKDIAPHLIAKYSREAQERLGVILLDSRQRILAEREVYIGQHDRVYVSPRWILKHALIEDADAIIIFHNHPTGDPEPSREDSQLTDRLKAVCVSMNIVLFDHIVIGRGRYYSFRDARRL